MAGRLPGIVGGGGGKGNGIENIGVQLSRPPDHLGEVGHLGPIPEGIPEGNSTAQAERPQSGQKGALKRGKTNPDYPDPFPGFFFRQGGMISGALKILQAQLIGSKYRDPMTSFHHFPGKFEQGHLCPPMGRMEEMGQVKKMHLFGWGEMGADPYGDFRFFGVVGGALDQAGIRPLPLEIGDLEAVVFARDDGFQLDADFFLQIIFAP